MSEPQSYAAPHHGDEPQPVISFRFTPSMISAVKYLAAGEGQTVSGWIRHVILRELARREGRCPTCHQPMPHE